MSDRKERLEAWVGSDGRVADGAQGGEVQLYRNNELAGEFAAAPAEGLLSVSKPGSKKWSAQLGEDDRGGLVLVRGQDGKPQVSLQATPKDGGFLGVHNAAGEIVAAVLAFGGRGVVSTNDENGKALFHTPLSGEEPAASSPISPSASPPVVDTGGTIESQIDGEFSGWTGDTIFPLTNGQIWQQASYSYHYHYAYRPKVIIYRSGAAYKMEVDGVSDPVYVKRLK